VAMDRKKLLNILNNQTLIIWDNLCEIHPRLSRYNPPIIELNGRLWRVAGLCHQESNIVELGYKFFAYSPDYANNMAKIILPHEIIHQADYNLFGLSEASFNGNYTMINKISWVGTLSSIIGAFIVASQLFFLGYCFFIIGSLSWLIVGYYRKDKSLITLNGTFFLANILGLYNSF